MLTLSQVAKELGVSYWTVRRWIIQKKLNAIRLPSGGYRVKKADIEAIKTCSNWDKK